MSEHAIEAWLRPPVELWSAAVAGTSASIALVTPWALMLTPDLGVVTAGVLGCFAGWRARAGFRVLRYQRNMRRLPVFKMRAADIPHSTRRLYLGKGFRWTQRHTQRLRDAMQPAAQAYIEAGRIERAFRSFEDYAESREWLRPLTRLTTTDKWWNPAPPRADVGGKSQLHGVELQEQDVWSSLHERVGHMLVAGTTRVGKTRLLEILVTQDIRRGDVVIVIDPKGDADLMKRVYAEAHRAGRGDQLYIFHLGYPELSARYNAIGSFSRITEVATRLTSPLPSSGNSAAFREFAWRFSNIIAKALVALGRKPSYREIQRHITDIEPLFNEYGRHALKAVPGALAEIEKLTVQIETKKISVSRSLADRAVESVALIEYVRRHPLDEPVLEGLAAAFKYERSFFDKIIASLGPLLDKLTTGKTAELLSPDYYNLDDPRPIFEWLQVIRQGGIVYVGLDALSDSAVAAAVGNSMFADLVSVAGFLYKNGLESTQTSGNPQTRKVSLHLDEFNELMGEEFIPMVNKAGGAGFQVTAYTQTVSDIEAKIGDAAKAQQVVGNFNTLVMLRVKNVETAELLTNGLPEVDVATLTMVSGATDSSDDQQGIDFVSRNEDRVSSTSVPIISPADVMALPKGQAFALLEGGNLWKIRMPLPDASDDPHMPDSLATIAAGMARRYRTSEQWWLGASVSTLTVDGERYGADDEALSPSAAELEPEAS